MIQHKVVNIMFDKVYGVIILALFAIIGVMGGTIYYIDKDRAKAQMDAMEASQKETEALLKVVSLTNELNTKTVEVVEKVNTVYVEKKVQEKPQIEYITKEIEKLVMLPSYSGSCFDSSGLQYVNSLITREYNHPTTTSKPSK